jgi:hypothetical protein
VAPFTWSIKQIGMLTDDTVDSSQRHVVFKPIKKQTKPRGFQTIKNIQTIQAKVMWVFFCRTA